MRRFSPEAYERIRARVEDGKIRVGSSAHLDLLDWDQAINSLTDRSQHIVRLAMKGWSHQLIADSLNMSRSRVSHVLSDFRESYMGGLE